MPNLLEPDVEKGQEILTIPDNIPFRPHRRKRPSRLTISDDAYPHERIEADIEQTVPNLLEPDVEKGQEILTIPDNIPFRPHRRKAYLD